MGLRSSLRRCFRRTPGLAKAPPGASHGAEHGHNDAFSAGEPGNPKKPSKLVRVTMGESDGKMLFAPARFEIRKGEQVKFVLRNDGELDHEFVPGRPPPDNLQHAEAMKKDPDMVHVDANGKRLAPKTSGEIVF